MKPKSASTNGGNKSDSHKSKTSKTKKPMESESRMLSQMVITLEQENAKLMRMNSFLEESNKFWKDVAKENQEWITILFNRLFPNPAKNHLRIIK